MHTVIVKWNNNSLNNIYFGLTNLPKIAVWLTCITSCWEISQKWITEVILEVALHFVFFPPLLSVTGSNPMYEGLWWVAMATTKWPPDVAGHIVCIKLCCIWTQIYRLHISPAKTTVFTFLEEAFVNSVYLSHYPYQQ